LPKETPPARCDEDNIKGGQPINQLETTINLSGSLISSPMVMLASSYLSRYSGADGIKPRPPSLESSSRHDERHPITRQRYWNMIFATFNPLPLSSFFCDLTKHCFLQLVICCSALSSCKCNSKFMYRVDDMFVDDLQVTFLLTGLRYQSQL
jgi:hypothetical protein